MFKKNIAFITFFMLVIILLFTNIIANAEIQSPFAEDDFNYSGVTSTQVTVPQYFINQGISSLNGGNGWSSAWKSNSGLTLDPTTSTYLVKTTVNNESANVIKLASTEIYRRFSTPISKNTAQDYYISWTAMNSNNFATSSYFRIRFNGTSFTEFGLTGANGTATTNEVFYPYIRRGNSGSDFIYGSTPVNWKVFNKFVLKLSIQSNGNATASLKVFDANNNEPSTYSVIATSTLTADLTYIGLSTVGATGYFDNLRLESYDPSNFAYNNALTLVSTLEANKTLENAIYANEAVEALNDGYAKSDLNSRMLAVAMEKGWSETQITSTIVTSTIPTNNSTAIDISKPVEINFTDSLSSFGTVIVKDTLNNTKVFVPQLTEKKLIISFPGKLDRNTTYTVIVEDALDSKGRIVDINPISFSTTFIPNINGICDGGTFEINTAASWSDLLGFVFSAKLKFQDSAEENYISGTPITQVGNYEITISAIRNSDNSTETLRMFFKISNPVAPTASNVAITGNSQIGSVLIGEYDYNDINGDLEGKSLYKWFVSDYEMGVYEQLSGETGKSYTFKSTDVSKYFKFEVTPYSNTSPYEGVAVLSDAFAGPFSPTISNVVIKGMGNIDEDLRVEYQYADKNGDTENGTEIQWLRSDNEHSIPIAILGAIANTYKVSQDDENKYIIVQVTPKNNGNPSTGLTVTSTAKSGPMAPTANNIKIEGDLKVGQVLGGYFTFSDLNGDEEGVSEYLWYLSGTNEKIGSGASLELTQNLLGKSIELEVIPVSSRFPFRGIPVRSLALNIPSMSKTSTASFSGGENNVTVPTVIQLEPSLQQPQKEKNISDFTDIDDNYAKDYIIEMVNLSIIKGVSKERFEPSRNITRAEFVALMVRISNIGEKEYEGVYIDVNKDDWFSGSIQSALSIGIISPNNTFRPNASITRQEISKILMFMYEYITKKDVKIEGDIKFEDSSDINEWARDYVNKVVTLGIMKGTGENIFSPLSFADRSQAVVVAKRILDIKKDGEIR